MKKKIISALLTAVMVFSLTACGGGSDKKVSRRNVLQHVSGHRSDNDGSGQR